MFPAGLLGYLIAITLVEPIRSHLGRRGIAVIAPVLRISAALVVATKPTFAVLLAINALYGIGTGLTDITWNNWASALSQPNLAQGLLHGSFSFGCILGPIVAVALLKVYPWNAFYFFVVSCYMPASDDTSARSRLIATGCFDMHRSTSTKLGFP